MKQFLECIEDLCPFICNLKNISAHFLNWEVCFFGVELNEFLNKFWILITLWGGRCLTITLCWMPETNKKIKNKQHFSEHHPLNLSVSYGKVKHCFLSGPSPGIQTPSQLVLWPLFPILISWFLLIFPMIKHLNVPEFRLWIYSLLYLNSYSK